MSTSVLVRRLSLLGLVAALSFACIGSTAVAVDPDLLAYDPFLTTRTGPVNPAVGQYSFGFPTPPAVPLMDLGGQDPTIGPTAFYAGAWIQSGGDNQGVVPGSLSYPNFPKSKGKVGEAVQFNCCSFGRTGRPIGDVFGIGENGLGGGRDPQLIYQSFLIDWGTQGTDDPTQFGKRGYEMWNGGVGDAFLAVDLFLNHFSGVTELTLAVTTPSGTVSAPVNGGGLDLPALAMANGGTHLVVMKFEFDPSTDDVVTVYLDPTDSVESNWTPAAVASVATSDLLITHHSAITNFTFSGGGHVPGAFDEVRWGKTFASVTPFGIPEPTTLALFLLGATSLIMARRR